MNRLSYIYLFCLFFIICSCDFSNRTKKYVEQGLEDATKQLLDSANIAESNFNYTFNSRTETLKDTSLLNNYLSLKNDLLDVSRTIDTLLNKLNLLNNQEPNNNEAVRLFFFNGNGNTLYEKLSSVYSKEIEICHDKEIRKVVQSKADKMLFNNNKSEFLEFFFGKSTSEMAVWTLLAIKAEIYNNGKLSIETTKKNYW